MLYSAARLGPDGFGQFALIQTTALLFTTFCALSLGQMASKIVAESLLAGPGQLGRSLSISYASACLFALILAFALASSAEFLAVHAGSSPQLASAYRLAALLVITGFLNAVQGGVILGLGIARQQALASLTVAPIVLVVFIFCAQRAD